MMDHKIANHGESVLVVLDNVALLQLDHVPLEQSPFLVVHLCKHRILDGAIHLLDHVLDDHPAPIAMVRRCTAMVAMPSDLLL